MKNIICVFILFILILPLKGDVEFMGYESVVGVVKKCRRIELYRITDEKLVFVKDVVNRDAPGAKRVLISPNLSRLIAKRGNRKKGAEWYLRFKFDVELSEDPQQTSLSTFVFDGKFYYGEDLVKFEDLINAAKDPSESEKEK